MKPSLNIRSAPEDDDDDGGEIRLGDLVTQVLARKWLVICSTVLGVMIGAFIGQLPPDEYQSSALVHLERRTQGIQLPEVLVGSGFTASTQQQIATESHIILSRFTLGPVSSELNLDWRLEPKRFPVIGHMAERRAWPRIPNWIAPRYTRHGDRITLGLLEVDQPLINRRASLTVTGPDSFEARLGGFDPVTGQVGELVQIAPGFRFRISAMSLPEGREFSLWRSDDIAATARVRRGLSISERAPRNSGIIDFVYTSIDRDLSVDVANAVTRSYQRQNLNRRAAEINQSIAFIEEQIPQAREATARAAEALRAFRERSGKAELTVGGDQLLQRIIGIPFQRGATPATADRESSRGAYPSRPDVPPRGAAR
jgi:tyrosine-protein kinase Etk/Wzc